MGKASQERMTGYRHDQRVVLGKRRGLMYHQRLMQTLRDRFLGKIVPEPAKPTRKEVEA